MYDQRLFNQEQGMGSGLASDDTYNLYDKALFADRGTGLFRPTAAAADEDAPAGGTILPDLQPPCRPLGLSSARIVPLACGALVLLDMPWPFASQSR